MELVQDHDQWWVWVLAVLKLCILLLKELVGINSNFNVHMQEKIFLPQQVKQPYITPKENTTKTILVHAYIFQIVFFLTL